MYSIKLASEVPNIRPICKLGFPDHTYADLCIVSSMAPVHNIPMNSVVLREALLANTEFIEKALSIKIVDVKDIKQAKPKPKAKLKPKPKPKPKVEEKAPEPKDNEDGDEAWKS